MKKKLIIFFLIVTNSGYAHDIKMAVFEIVQNEHGFQMSITLDKEDFLRTLSSLYGAGPDNLRGLQGRVWQYFDSHLMITINDQCTSLTINTIQHGKENIVLNCSLNLPVGRVEEVRIENYCMIDQIDKHENIMRLKLSDRDRSFRLNRDRVSTTAKYDI